MLDAALPPSQFDALVEKVDEEKSAEGKLRIAAKMTRLLYEAEQERLGAIQGTSVLGPEFQKVEREQEERRYRRQKKTIETMKDKGLLADGMSVSEARDILWAFTSRDLYRLFVTSRGWSPDKYESWLAETLIHQLRGPAV